jgi:hypothetical protein
LYLQAVKCHAASSERKAAAKPRPIYAIVSNILIEIMIERYKIVGKNILQMISIASIIINLRKRLISTTLEVSSVCKHSPAFHRSLYQLLGLDAMENVWYPFINASSIRLVL